jgi:hypothetical protein
MVSCEGNSTKTTDMGSCQGNSPYDSEEESGEFDCVSILHAGKGRAQVVAEAARVLRQSSLFVSSDPMQRDCVDAKELSAVYARIGLDGTGSGEWAAAAGMRFKQYADFTERISQNRLATITARSRRCCNRMESVHASRAKCQTGTSMP